ncbi:hypothetical protein FAM09_15265 [Niastella caeni]|uniref:Uncharacterized protein n=1 Tax=Niastella caeni TaxID=2569763 RepID=A0A4S8HRI0_9BACT|nr:hypothetical protein [Niastella caeni]THU38043.1 hypothetical protein FAM09_15265 [Niastella caeni]
MELANKLEQLINEYLCESDEKSIQHILFSIPEHKGLFYILDSFKLNLKSSKPLSLSILFTFNHNTRQGKFMVDKITRTNCFDGFDVIKNRRNLMYSKDFGNNKPKIIEMAKHIISSLFPEVNTNAIGVELKRIEGWHRLEGQNIK